jgi:hypothetical protein
MLAGSNGARKGLRPAFVAGNWAQNGNVPVAAHIVPVCVEHSMWTQEAGSEDWRSGLRLMKKFDGIWVLVS